MWYPTSLRVHKLFDKFPKWCFVGWLGNLIWFCRSNCQLWFLLLPINIHFSCSFLFYFILCVSSIRNILTYILYLSLLWRPEGSYCYEYIFLEDDSFNRNSAGFYLIITEYSAVITAGTLTTHFNILFIK